MAAFLLSLLIAAAPGQHVVPSHRHCALRPGTVVDVAVTSLQAEALGAAIKPEPPLAAQVTRLRYAWGYRFLPQTRLFAHLDIVDGAMAIGRARSGCWFSWSDARPTGQIHVKVIEDPSLERPGMLPERPEWIPQIAGFRFVAARRTARPPFAWVGVWRASGGGGRSRVIAFTGPTLPQKLLTELPFAAGALSALPDPHGIVVGISVSEDNRPGTAARIVGLDWLEPRPLT